MNEDWKPIIRRTWNGRTGTFKYEVVNSPPQNSWTGSVNPVHRQRWVKAIQHLPRLNGATS